MREKYSILRYSYCACCYNHYMVYDRVHILDDILKIQYNSTNPDAGYPGLQLTGTAWHFG